MKIILVIVAILLISYPIAYFSSQQVIEVTVTDKVITVDEGLSKYLVYTDKEVLENVDETLFFKFNSSDIQSYLTVGKIYKVLVVGWRIPLISGYRNIVGVR